MHCLSIVQTWLSVSLSVGAYFCLCYLSKALFKLLIARSATCDSACTIAKVYAQSLQLRPPLSFIQAIELDGLNKTEATIAILNDFLCISVLMDFGKIKFMFLSEKLKQKFYNLKRPT